MAPRRGVDDDEGIPLRSIYDDQEEDFFGAMLDDEFQLPPSRRSSQDVPASEQLASLLAEAAFEIGRLNEAYRQANEGVQDGFRLRVQIIEAAASTRLSGAVIDPDEILIALHAHLVKDESTVSALLHLSVVSAAARRRPGAFWTPLRFSAFAQVLDKLGQDDPRTAPRLDALTIETVTRTLSTEVLNWKGLSPPLAAAEIIRSLGLKPPGYLSRILAVAWLWRSGWLPAWIIPLSEGFRARPGTYRIADKDWREQFLEALKAAAVTARSLLMALDQSRSRLLINMATQRSTSSVPELANLLCRRLAVTPGEAAKALGISPFAARKLLSAAEHTGAIREISGRKSFRIYRLII